MQGLPVKEGALLKLFGLSVYAFDVSNDTDTDMGMEVIAEIKEKLDIDMFNFDYNNQVKIFLYETGLITENPDYNEEFSNKVLERLQVD